jgi:hypothetical protein
VLQSRTAVKRRLFNLLAALSLLLCAATGVMWMRSYWRAECFMKTWVAKDDEVWKWLIESCNGVVCFGHLHALHVFGYSEGSESSYWCSTPNPDESAYPIAEPRDEQFRVFGIELLINSRGSPIHITSPYWVFLVATGLLPAAWLFVRRRVNSRALSGLCADCGYDLRATPEQCPECGAVADGPVAPSARSATPT